MMEVAALSRASSWLKRQYIVVILPPVQTRLAVGSFASFPIVGRQP